MSDRHLQHFSNSSNGSEPNREYFSMLYDCDNDAGVKFWAVSLLLFFSIGVPACVAILFEMLKIHRRGTPFSPNEFLMLHLTVMDLVFLLPTPLCVLNLHIWRNFTFDKILNSAYALSAAGRPLMMAFVCLDCYVAVVHPVIYHERKSLTPRVVMVAAAWAVTVVYGIAFYISDAVYFSMISNVPFIITIATVGICDFFIVKTLKRSDPGRPSIHPQKQRAIQTLINSLVMTIISYLPPTLLTAIMRPLISTMAFVCFVGVPLSLTSTSGSAVMPVLYLNNLGKLDRFKFGCCRKSQP